MEQSLQFVIMVETPNDQDFLMSLLIGSFDLANERKSNSFDLRGNWIEIWANDDADSVLASEPITGYLHYHWRIESTPMRQDLTENDQAQFAKDLVACLESCGCQCVICANFEHLL